MNPSKLSQLKIDPDQKRRPRANVLAIFAVVVLAILSALYFAWFRGGDERRVVGTKAGSALEKGHSEQQTTAPAPPETNPAAAAVPGVPALSAKSSAASGLTVSGYIINRERIEVSPRFQGVVSWIGVRKGDAVKTDQIVVRLDDAEQRARVAEAEGRSAAVKVELDRAQIVYRRTHDLFVRSVATQEAEDEARLGVEAAKANVVQAEGQLALVKAYLDWTVIRSPIDGVVLEKLVEPGELVVPMSYGGGRGPSTALIAVADPKDLQVELDVNEADLAKISLGRTCRVIPEAYPDKHYEGVVAEIAPEANRQKGTLQIKVQIRNPDRYLTPELTAKVEFSP